MAKEVLKFKTTGFKELNDVLIEMAEDLGYKKTARRVLVPAIKEALKPVMDRAKSLAPFDEKNFTTPHLRDSFRVEARIPNNRDARSIYHNPNDVAIGQVTVKTDKRAISQEFGNEQVAPQPYLRPALESEAQRVINIFGTHITYRIQRYKAKGT